MIKYCKYCREMHEENELCAQYKSELKKHPEWLVEISQAVRITGEVANIQSQGISGKKKTD